MLLLVNHQPIPLSIEPKSISPEQSCYNEIAQAIAETSTYCLTFSTSKNKDLKRISKSANNIVLPLKFLKVCFSLVK